MPEEFPQVPPDIAAKVKAARHAARVKGGMARSERKTLAAQRNAKRPHSGRPLRIKLTDAALTHFGSESGMRVVCPKCYRSLPVSIRVVEKVRGGGFAVLDCPCGAITRAQERDMVPIGDAAPSLPAPHRKFSGPQHFQIVPGRSTPPSPTPPGPSQSESGHSSGGEDDPAASGPLG